MSDSSHHTPGAFEAAQAAQASAENFSDALRTSEMRYRRLFETARDGILLLDSDQGYITDANPFMTELLGYSHDQLIGKQLWEIGLIRDKQSAQDAFQILKREGYIRYDNLPLENHRDEKREVEFVSNLYREDGSTVIQCNIRDITDRKRSEGVLADSAIKNERIAETLQRSMLAASPAKFPGLVVETLYKAAMNEAEVGGDFFDAFALSGNRVALVVGDVSGKGLNAAGRTAEVKYALRAFLHEYQSPEIAIGRLNGFICETHRLDHDSSEVFIVLALAVVDTVTGETIFTAAGAEPSIILRANGKSEQIEVYGIPLGVTPESEYAILKSTLAVGDSIVMSTDGITEARRGSEFLGVRGLASLAEQADRSASLSMIIQSIYLGAVNFANGVLRDDACLLLARRQ